MTYLLYSAGEHNINNCPVLYQLSTTDLNILIRWPVYAAVRLLLPIDVALWLDSRYIILIIFIIVQNAPARL